MAIDNLATWKSTFNVLPPVSDGTWTTAFSDWVDARVTGKAVVTNVTHAISPFTFAKATFKTQLDSLTIQSSRATAATNFANAWKSAIDASVLATAIGDFINPGGVALTWGAITSSVLDAASRTAARNSIETDINNAALASTPNDSEMPRILRDAFLLLTCTIIGLDSQVPPVGPLPLTIVASPLL